MQRTQHRIRVIPLTLALGLAGLTLCACDRRAAAPATQQVGFIRHEAISESSGVIASRRYPNVYWTHNDRGNDAEIYAITRDGQFIAEVKIDAKHGDWEDIAIDDAGRLYIGKIGNNEAKRETVEVLCIEEPDPSSPPKRVKVLRSWRLKFPEAPFDSESLFIHGEHGYLISKVRKGEQATLYRFFMGPSKKASVLEKVCTLPIRSPVTGADISADGKRLAVLSVSGLFVFRVDGDLNRLSNAAPAFIPAVGDTNMEGCCFTEGGVLVTSESRRIYFYPDSLFDLSIAAGK